jgi:hypothetical protein
VEAAEQMPSDKYGFTPSLHLRSFAGLIVRVVGSNNDFCAVAGGLAAPESKELKGTDSKEKLIAALNSSFGFCQTAFVKVQDWQLAEVVPFTGEMISERVGALFALVEEWADEYKAAAIYLRLNGLEPPIYGRDR